MFSTRIKRYMKQWIREMYAREHCFTREINICVNALVSLLALAWIVRKCVDRQPFYSTKVYFGHAAQRRGFGFPFEWSSRMMIDVRTLLREKCEIPILVLHIFSNMLWHGLVTIAMQDLWVQLFVPALTPIIFYTMCTCYSLHHVISRNSQFVWSISFREKARRLPIFARIVTVLPWCRPACVWDW